MISIRAKSSWYYLLLIVVMLRWLSKSSSVKLNADSCFLGFTKKSLSAVLGLLPNGAVLVLQVHARQESV